MPEPLFLYREQAEDIVARLLQIATVNASLTSVQEALAYGIANQTDPVRIMLDPPDAAALETALKQVLSPHEVAIEPWLTIVGRLAILRGQLPARHWRSR